MSFDGITNRGEFFSNHYLGALLANDLGGIRQHWDEFEERGERTARSRLRSVARAFFNARAVVTESSPGARAEAVRVLNDVVLAALGFEVGRTELELTRATTDTLRVPASASVETSTGLLLVALDAGLAADVDDLFSSSADDADPAGVLLAPLWRDGDKQSVPAAVDAVGELFAVDEPPRFVLILGGRIVLLAERAKWAEGRFLAVDLDGVFERNDTTARGELETVAALFSADGLVPGSLGDTDSQGVLDELVDKSYKHAVGVSKELRNGIRESIEILANEVIVQLDDTARQRRQRLYTRSDVDDKDLTQQCLRWLYRLLVLLYAESRPELGIVPTDDDAYLAGYSLDRLRELALVELDTDRALNGSHIHESLKSLFTLVNDGYHADNAVQTFALDSVSEETSREEYLAFPGLDASLFDSQAAPLLDGVVLRNEALQRVLALLMLSPEGKGRSKRFGHRGFISYAQLGINQLGSVYEGLMAYTGFFAAEDLYEVAKHGDPSDGTWVLPVTRADEYPDDVFVTRTDPITGRNERVMHRAGSFVFRLAGRDRQRSASYYTPEVLTQCVVKHALAELLGLDDYAPEHGSSGITEATQILDLTICEPALGSGAFLNEAINQLAAEYLKRRQVELGETLDPERYRHEAQKVKAHLALHQSYGVDLNATAVELAEVSLWLNCMHPGLKAPWFGLQLRRGNSLIGCRRATWRTSQLTDRPWAKVKKGEIAPPIDHKLADGALADDEIHHFLLPGHGWAAVADRKEARELRPDETAALREWRKSILAAPKKADAARLRQLAAATEELWSKASERIRLTQRALRRTIDVYGSPIEEPTLRITRARAERVLGDPDSALGRLRALMDGWVGLWFWPLDSGVRPPSWNDWLVVAEELVGVEDHRGPTGQLSFDDLDDFLSAEERDPGRLPVADLKERHAWLGIAIDAARREGAWHWELEFAPRFQAGGFDLQVGNPPWVRPRWYEDLVLAEIDPWWGVTEAAPARQQQDRRATDLADKSAQRTYLDEIASSEGVTETLGSPVLRAVLTGVQTNLYMVMMDTTWRHLSLMGIVGLVQPIRHMTDPKARSLRRESYARLRRLFSLYNAMLLFEDIDFWVDFGLAVYGSSQPTRFEQVSNIVHPDVADRSFRHDGAGELPGIQYPQGGWDLRPHAARILTITEETLTDWARLFDEPGTPATEARLLRPVTTADLEALSVLADQPVRLADHQYHWTSGWHEKSAKTDGTIRWRTGVPASWDEVILQGPHFTVATPFAKQPNDPCRHNQDYSDWDLESLPQRKIPRTNYQRAVDRDVYNARLDHWKGKPSTTFWRLAWRAMTQPGLERSLHASLLHPGPAHIGGAFSLTLESSEATVLAAALWSSLPIDYIVKVSGTANVKEFVVARFPQPVLSRLSQQALVRTLRLNCLTADYTPLWEELYKRSWQLDRWTHPAITEVELGDIGSSWTMATPLRRDFERRMALVELDALAALMLGLSAEQLCAMYRTQFAVLRKYEYRMAFDAEGRKLCGYHQSAGYRQAQLQERAKAGELPKDWTNLWTLFERYESDPSSVDWLGHYTPPFYRPDREKEMTTAFEEFQRRQQSGEYGDD